MKQKLITDYFTDPNPNSNKRKYVDDELDTLTKQTLLDITNAKKTKNIIKGYNPETDSWHCLECGIDMGPSNPRQLCGKWYCKFS